MPNAELLRMVATERHALIAEIDTQRRRGALVDARRLAERVLSDHPDDADLHDALARVLVDANELQLAEDAWEAARMFSPLHVGALKGLGFLAFRRRDLRVAEQWLTEALAQSPEDNGVRAALARISNDLRREPSRDVSSPPSRNQVERDAQSLSKDQPRTVAVSEASAFVLLCDTEGLVLAGTLGGANGEGQRSQTACDLGVLANNLSRACAHLGLGTWESCLLESDHDAHVVAVVGERVLVLSESAGEGAAGRLLARLPELSARAASHIGGAL